MVQHAQSAQLRGRRAPYGPGIYIEPSALSNGAVYRLADLLSQARERNTALSALLDSVSDGLVAVDTDTRISYLNRSAARLLGVDAGVVGIPIDRLLCFIDAAGKADISLSRRMVGALSRGKPFRASEAWIKAKGGRVLPVSIDISHLETADGSCITAVVALRDLSQQRETDSLNDNIISLVSHELRTPLMHIKGFASSLLQPDVQWDEETRLDFIRTIDREADRLAKLVNDLLGMSRLQSGKIPLQLQPTAPYALVRAGLKQAAPFLADHRVSVRVSPRLPLVLADSTRIEQVLVNLLENAAKYSPKGTLIKVKVSRGRSSVVFCVADSGVGIHPDDRERIFEKFVRVRHPDLPQPPGTGLGLALCKTIVEEHKGSIWVESCLGRGSSFSFTLSTACSDCASD